MKAVQIVLNLHALLMKDASYIVSFHDEEEGGEEKDEE